MKVHFYLLTFLSSFLASSFFLFGPVVPEAGFFLFFGTLFCLLTLLWIPVSYRNYLAFLFLGFIGAFILGRETMNYWQESSVYTLDHERVSVVEYPEEKGFYQKVILKNEHCTESFCKKNILWEASLSQEIHAGESFLFSCSLEEVENFSEEFDYRMYLAKEGVGFLCKNGIKGEATKSTEEGFLRMKLESLRLFTENNLQRALPEPELGLAKGLVLGGSNYLSESLEKQFQRVGMTHIVAVSGYNILLVAALFLVAATSIGLWKKQALLVALVGISIFILFVGAPASAVRAGSMAALSFLALFTGRRSTGFVILLLSAVGMLIFNPLLLFYDIGFQLSFLALLGILFSLSEEESQVKGVRAKIKQAFQVTLWVELFVMPVILYHFGTLSWFSFIANMVLIPLVPLAMFGSFTLVSLGAFLPNFLLPLVSFPVYICLRVIISFVEYFGSLPSIIFEGIHISLEGLFFWYGFIITLGVLQLHYAKKKWYAKAFVVDHTDCFDDRTSY